MAKTATNKLIDSGFLGFPLSLSARRKYQLDHEMLNTLNRDLLVNQGAALQIAEKVNTVRKLSGETPISGGQLYALALIDQIFQHVIWQYRQQINSKVFDQALDWLNNSLSPDQVNETLLSYIDQFVQFDDLHKPVSPESLLSGESDGYSHQGIFLQNQIILWLHNVNPAAVPLRELFDDRTLDQDSEYNTLIRHLDNFFHYQPNFGPQNQQLVSMLRTPAIVSPNSLKGQLDYIYTHWADLLGDLLNQLLLLGIDLLAEEQLKFGTGGPGPVEPYDFSSSGAADSPVKFSPDSNWMPSLVLLAKNTYVWLDQLSKKYQRDLKHLDQIPDEELHLLANQGITGLWLIGLWQRSSASQRIKKMMGDPDAIASAYSLEDYRIADDFGGETAMDNLRSRAWQHGIRMASDMVPNHMGIDSRWVIEHPDWFLSLDHSPYPGYTFNGPNLAQRDDIGIFLEDKYFNRSDAAVVFKRVNFDTGEERFIYHGNDGTALPWNDTAQLDFSKAEVREGVIQTILHVARQFPIIRFDAAMTLAKQHIQRLWFPPHGQGGAIPSRAGRGMSEVEFEKAIPQEFWREVVDRVAKEAPDTLLLAEAFWMMEGYFVRSLGMHRVYNSAFMHMLRDETNQKYRQLVKNTLEFDPQILKRYVNFMSNPDEETAAGQFGKGDKYFGVAIVMATMPGLPMIGHGQLEGFVEKYGMEFKRAKLEEKVDQELYSRHEQLIFPLFRRRKLFAEVENFFLYDLYTSSGYVNEEVLAYSNRSGDQRALVVYHNRFGDTRGWIKTSVAYLDTNKQLTQKSLGEGLALPDDPHCFVTFRDHVSGREYLRNCREIHEKGLFLELYAYQAFVFLDFSVIDDRGNGMYHRLCEHLGGRSVGSISEAMEEMILQTLHAPYSSLVNPGMYRYLLSHFEQGYATPFEEVFNEVGEKAKILIAAISQFTGIQNKPEPTVKKIIKMTEALFALPRLSEVYPYPRGRKYKQLGEQLHQRLNRDSYCWYLLFSYAFSASLGKQAQRNNYSQISLAWIEQWRLAGITRRTIDELGFDPQGADFAAQLLHLLVREQDWRKIKAGERRKPYLLAKKWLEDQSVRQLLGVNVHQNVTWFNREAMENWLWWAMAIGVVEVISDAEAPKADLPKRLTELYDMITPIQSALPNSEYQVEKLLRLLKPGRKS